MATWELWEGHMVAMSEPWAAWELENGHMVVMGESWAACGLGFMENEQWRR